MRCSLRSNSYTDEVDIPTLTAPTTRSESISRTGTFARIDGPRVPVCSTTSSRPDSATEGSVLTGFPNSVGLGCDSRIPRSLVITTNSTPVPARTLVAMFCNGPFTSSSAGGTSPSYMATSARTAGAAASTRAMSRDRWPYSSISRLWYTTASRAKAMPSVSATTASCNSRICVASRISIRCLPGTPEA